MTYSITTGGRRAGKSKALKLVFAAATGMIPRVSEAVKAMKNHTIITNDSCNTLVEEMKHYKYKPKEDAPRLPGSFKHRSNKR